MTSSARCTALKIVAALGLGCLSFPALAHGYPEIALVPILMIAGAILVVHGLVVWALLGFRMFKSPIWLGFSLLVSAYEFAFAWNIAGLIVGGRISSFGEVVGVVIVAAPPSLLAILPLRQFRRLRRAENGRSGTPPLPSDKR